MTLCFSSMAPNRYKLRVIDMDSISDTKNMEIGTLSNVSSEKQNAELSVSQTVSAMPKQKQSTIGSSRSASHRINLSEHDAHIYSSKTEGVLRFLCRWYHR